VREADSDKNGVVSLEEFNHILLHKPHKRLEKYGSEWGKFNEDGFVSRFGHVTQDVARSAGKDMLTFLDTIDDFLSALHTKCEEGSFTAPNPLWRFASKFVGCIPEYSIEALAAAYTLPLLSEVTLYIADFGFGGFLKDALVTPKLQLWLGLCVVLVLPLLALTVALFTRGQTVGYWLMGFTAVDSHKNTPLTYDHTIFRFWVVPGVMLYVWALISQRMAESPTIQQMMPFRGAEVLLWLVYPLLNWGTAFTNQAHHTFEDLLSGTTVVCTSSLSKAAKQRSREGSQASSVPRLIGMSLFIAAFTFVAILQAASLKSTDSQNRLEELGQGPSAASGMQPIKTPVYLFLEAFMARH